MEPGIAQRPFPPRGHFWPGHWTVKTKLVVTACIPLLVLIPIVAMLVWSAGQAAYTKILISKVRSDLVLAQQKFNDVQESKSLALKAWSESAYLRNVLQRRGGKLDNAELAVQAEKMGFAYLRLINPRGLVLNSFPARLPYMLEPESQRSVRLRESGSYTVLLSNTELRDISPALATGAVQAIVPTSNASPSPKSAEDRGLVVQVLQPLFHEGALLGVLEGGLLLNGNLGLVDEINNLIYSPNTLLEGSLGTTTV